MLRGLFGKITSCQGIQKASKPNGDRADREPQASRVPVSGSAL